MNHYFRIRGLLLMASASACFFVFQNCGSIKSLDQSATGNSAQVGIVNANDPQPTPTLSTSSGTAGSSNNVQIAAQKVKNEWLTISTVGAPATRYFHTAVWTGTEMVVWGGNTDTGGRYNLAGDSWQATSLTGAPSSRRFHCSVWTGSEMIVWGGFTSGAVGSALGNGAIYNPTDNTWRPVAATGAPTARTSHYCVWTGSEMIVWGGGPSGNSALNNGGLFNPATNTWRPMSLTNAPSGRLADQGDFAYFKNGKMYIFGGVVPPNETPAAGGGIYDPATDTWTLLPSAGAPNARAVPMLGIYENRLNVLLGEGRSNGFSLDLTGMQWMPEDMTGAPGFGEQAAYVFTGLEFLVFNYERGIYDVGLKQWIQMSVVNAPPMGQPGWTSVWTGKEAILFGGRTGTQGYIFR